MSKLYIYPSCYGLEVHYRFALPLRFLCLPFFLEFRHVCLSIGALSPGFALFLPPPRRTWLRQTPRRRRSPDAIAAMVAAGLSAGWIVAAESSVTATPFTSVKSSI